MADHFTIDGRVLDEVGDLVGCWVVTSSGRTWTYDRRRSLGCSWMREDGLVGDRRVIAQFGLDGMDRLFPTQAEA